MLSGPVTVTSRVMTSRQLPTPWWPLATALPLAAALAIAVTAGRVIDGVIVGALLVPALGLLALWVVARRRGQLDGNGQ